MSHSSARKKDSGFTLLELLVSIAIFLLIAWPIMASMSNSQRIYRTSELRVSLEQKMRAALELMAQEVSQAGLQPSGVDTDGLGLPLTTVAASACSPTCIAAGTAGPIQVTSVAGLYVGEWVWVDANPGPNCYLNNTCEQKMITNVSAGPPATLTFHTAFAANHTAQTINGTTFPTPIYGLGQYPQGIVPPPPYANTATPSGGSTSTQLELFGDLNGNAGSLLAVIYSCPSQFPGPFTRTLYDATSGSQISSTSLIDNVTSCQFTYPNPLPQVPAGCNQTPAGNMSGEYIIPSVGITITAQSLMSDPATGSPVSVTKSFLNIQPRNIISVLNVVCSQMTNELQQNPGSLP